MQSPVIPKGMKFSKIHYLRLFPDADPAPLTADISRVSHSVK
jgi:hypothetical protein